MTQIQNDEIKKKYIGESKENSKIEFNKFQNLKKKLKEGRGIYYYNDGERYEGDWKNDLKDGKGIYYYNDGERYEGDWKNDLKQGKGIFYFFVII